MVSPERRWWNIGATKIPHAERDIVHSVMRDPAVQFYDVIGADTEDDHPVFGIGSNTAYSLYLTDEQASRMMDASNARYVEPDVMVPPVQTPTVRTNTWMGVGTFPQMGDWHGKDVPIALLDQGNTQAVRTVKGWTLKARQYFANVPSGEIWPNQIHGCLTSSCAVPDGGIVMDGQITADSGSASTAAIAAAIKWAADNGAKVINCSFGGLYSPMLPVADAFDYISDVDVEYYGSAGNDSVNNISYPAAYSRNYSYVNSLIAFDETTDARGSFSSYAADATGCAPGVLVNGMLPDATERTWSGTSAASPHAAGLCARIQTGGRFTARQAGAMLRANLRDTGRGAEQGGGAFNLQRAVQGLYGGGGGGGITTVNHSLLAVI